MKIKNLLGLILITVSLIFSTTGFGLVEAHPFTAQSGVKVNLTYTLKDYDNQGKLVYSVTRAAHSYLYNFAYVLYAHFLSLSTSSGLTITDTGNNSRSNLINNTGDFGMGGASGSTTIGIVVGTGTAAVTASDIKLGTLIANGSSAGQLQYSNETFTTPVVAGSTSSFTTSRTVANGSGNTITINEIGIYAYATYYAATYYTVAVCMVHDVLGAGQPVANGHSLTITYTISVSD